MITNIVPSKSYDNFSDISSNSKTNNTLRKFLSLPILNKIKDKNSNSELVISNKKTYLQIVKFSIPNSKNYLTSFIKMHPNENYIGIFTVAKIAKRKKFNLIFDYLNNKNKVIKALSHPVRNMVFNKKGDKVIFISSRKHHDKIKMLELNSDNIDKIVSKNITNNLNLGILNDITVYKNNYLITIATNSEVSIIQCDCDIAEESNAAWSKLYSFYCDSFVVNIKFSENSDFIFTTLIDKSLVIHQLDTKNLTWHKLIKLENVSRMPLDVSFNNEILICSDKELYIINSNENKDNIMPLKVMDTKYIKIRSACFIEENKILVNLYDNLASINKTCIYKKTKYIWEVTKNIKFNRAIADMKSNLKKRKVYIISN